MKTALLIFAWASLIGSIGDGLIALYGGYLILSSNAVELTITVEELIKNHIAFLYWVKQIAYYVLPEPVVSWIFSLAAMFYFPARVIISIVVGLWVLRLAHKM